MAVKRALMSCHDKAGLDAFAKGLVSLGVELIASKGTAEFLRQHGVVSRTVEEFAGISEQLDGRVKTLHPRIHAGILARRDTAAHVEAAGVDGLIDLVVVNLYPFQETVRRQGVSLQEALEQIDIGGVALLRAAAKNFPSVLVVSHSSQYAEVLNALQQGRGMAPEAVHRRLAMAAFALTSGYDQAIATFVGDGQAAALPEHALVSLRRHQALRYGENPHQPAAWYVPTSEASGGLAGLVQRQGKELSYNNLLDIATVTNTLADFTEPACVIVKHASPCGVATASTLAEAYQRALAGDEESAFGGIVGFNRPLDVETAQRMAGMFLEVIVAPVIDDAVQAVVAKKPSVRLVCVSPSSPSGIAWRQLAGAWLGQASDRAVLDAATLRVVTTRQPTDAERQDLVFAWTCAKHVTSNAIVIANRQATVGIGQGQPSRVRAVRLAIQNAGARACGAVAASDGFFPFSDSIEALAAAGVIAVMQPGGSVKDAEVIAAADRAGLAMLLTGLRHFRH